jgi:plastocyanin
VLLLAGCGGDDGGGGGSDGGGTVVEITDDGFEPSTLTVSSGDTVTFENKSSDDAWPASNVHPTHQLYPGFDAKKPLLSGESYSFTFTKAGSWGYHNHLEPDEQGTIVVE